MLKYFEFDVSLVGIKPRIWRRFLLPAKATFQDLHDAIQDAFGWEQSHLFSFRDVGRRGEEIARMDYEDPYGEDPAPIAQAVPLSAHLDRKGGECVYIYDFGDNWEHRVKVRDLIEDPEKFKRRLLAGARACPSEDSGGTWGYEECCQALAMTDEELSKLSADDRDEVESRLEWLGDWQPEAFDLEATRKRFDR